MRPILPTFFAALMFVGVPVIGQQPITLNDVEEGLPEISPDEPIAKVYSATHAAQYLDRSALNWQKTKKCAICSI